MTDQIFNFRSIVSRTSTKELLPFVDQSVIDILSIFDSNALEGDKLKSFILTSRSIKNYLKAPSTRIHVIKLLTLAEAQDLCAALNIEPKHTPHNQIISHLVANPSALSILIGLFGSQKEQTTKSSLNGICTIAPQYKLFDHQRDVIFRIDECFTSPPHRVILHMPTGSGKTRTSMHFIARHLKHHQKTVVVWLAFSSELLEQAASEFEVAWAYLGDRDLAAIRYWGSRDSDITSIKDGILFAGFGKLYAASNRDSNLLPSVGDTCSLVIVDEAHQAIAPTYSTIINTLCTKRPGTQLLGLTATPGRTYSDISEDKRLSDFFSNKKCSLEVAGFDNPVKYLIEMGYLANTSFRTIKYSSTNNPSTIKYSTTIEGDIPEDVLNELAVDQKWTIQILREIDNLIKKHRRVIVFATTKEHALLMNSITQARGIDSDSVVAETSDIQRQSILQRYKSNSERPMVLFNFGVLTTGFDAPSTSAAIIARPTNSLVLYSQMVGRAIRGPKANGNKSAEIVTVVDIRLKGFGDIAEAFHNWEDIYHEQQK